MSNYQFPRWRVGSANLKLSTMVFVSLALLVEVVKSRFPSFFVPLGSFLHKCGDATPPAAAADCGITGSKSHFFPSKVW